MVPVRGVHREWLTVAKADLCGLGCCTSNVDHVGIAAMARRGTELCLVGATEYKPAVKAPSKRGVKRGNPVSSPVCAYPMPAGGTCCDR